MRSPDSPPLLLALSLALVALACRVPQASENRVETSVASTLQARQTENAAAISPTSTPPMPSAATTPSSTPSPTLSPTPPAPRASLTGSTNCRNGPLKVYDLVIALPRGAQVELVGKNNSGTYWYIRDEAGRECWLFGGFAEVSGETEQLPIFTPPPSPTPMHFWAGTWTISYYDDQGRMELSEDEQWISGVANFSEDQRFDIIAVIADGGTLVNGDLMVNGETIVIFTWYLADSGDQFVGTWTEWGGDATGPFCGAREGVPLPVPCAP